jgi:hypothetical protein
MNNNPDSPTRSKSAFSDENPDDDTSKVVFVPRWLFLALIGIAMFEATFLFFLFQTGTVDRIMAGPHTIKVDGGCTIEAKAVTLKGAASAYRLVPVDSPPPTR